MPLSYDQFVRPGSSAANTCGFEGYIIIELHAPTNSTQKRWTSHLYFNNYILNKTWLQVDGVGSIPENNDQVWTNNIPINVQRTKDIVTIVL